ncbi:MAG: hypothetical protein WBG43_00015 [Marinifilaceae bacterium]
MSIETSARKSSYLSNLINLPVSSSTCLRLVDSCNIPLNTDVENIGIDDWAYRQGISYGTIIVNRETGKAIDLIKSRKKEDIIKWLKKHSNIKQLQEIEQSVILHLLNLFYQKQFKLLIDFI